MNSEPEVFRYESLFQYLLVFIVITLLGYFLHVAPIYLFICSGLAIIPLAKYIGEATEELTIYTGPAIGGLMNATLGNATEFIISIFALQAGLIEVVKASITGSILGNLLLVLGTAIFLGGQKKVGQEFNPIAAKAAGSTLLLAIIALVMPAIFLQTTDGAGASIIEELSIVVSLLMIISYVASLLFSLRTHKHLYTEDVAEAEGKWTKKKSILVLIFAVIGVSFMSEILVGSIEPLVHTFGWTELFIGVVFVAIIGNAAEHASAITMAIKNKMNLALQISIGSATQMAMFVAPALVLISLFFPKNMNLIFNNFELIAMMLSVFIVNSIIEDGKSNWFEGLQLLIAYFIIAVAFFFHP